MIHHEKKKKMEENTRSTMKFKFKSFFVVVVNLQRCHNIYRWSAVLYTHTHRADWKERKSSLRCTVDKANAFKIKQKILQAITLWARERAHQSYLRPFVVLLSCHVNAGTCWYLLTQLKWVRQTFRNHIYLNEIFHHLHRCLLIFICCARFNSHINQFCDNPNRTKRLLVFQHPLIALCFDNCLH